LFRLLVAQLVRLGGQRRGQVRLVGRDLVEKRGGLLRRREALDDARCADHPVDAHER